MAKKKSFLDSKISEDERVISEIRLSLENKAVPYLIAHPGIGKTSLAKKVNPNNLVYNIATFTLSDLIGEKTTLRQSVNYTDEYGRSVTKDENVDDAYSRPIWYSELLIMAKNCDRCLLIFDDFSSISPKLQKYIFGLFEEDRVIGSHKIPSNVDILFCGDNEEYTDIDKTLDLKLSAKLKRIEIKPSINDWLHWANKNGINNVVKSYLNQNPKELLKDVKTEDGKYDYNLSLTPNNWSKRISVELNISEELGLKPRLDHYMDESMKENFLEFYSKYHDFKIEEIMQGLVRDVNRFTYSDNDLSFIVNALIVSAYKKEEIECVLDFLTKVGYSEYKDLFMSVWSSINSDKDELIKMKDAIISSSKRGEGYAR